MNGLLHAAVVCTGTVVLTAAALIMAILLAWLVSEVFLSVEDRILSIIRVQKPMFNYLRHHKLYERLMDDYKAGEETRS